MSKRKRIQGILGVSFFIMLLMQWDGFMLVAQETVTSVDGGTSMLDEILTRYGAFAPLLLGLIIIALRRKFFPDSNDKK